MSGLFQIYEDDLAELERIVPDICSKLMCELQPRQKSQFRRLKEIISNVRWDYGPMLIAKRLEDDEPDDDATVA